MSRFTTDNGERGLIVKHKRKLLDALKKKNKRLPDTRIKHKRDEDVVERGSMVQPIIDEVNMAITKKKKIRVIVQDQTNDMVRVTIKFPSNPGIAFSGAFSLEDFSSFIGT